MFVTAITDPMVFKSENDKIIREFTQFSLNSDSR